VSRPPCCLEVAARIKALKQQGYSLQKIADLLNAEGVPTLMGRSPWRKSHVDGVLSRLYVRELPVESDEVTRSESRRVWAAGRPQ